MPTYNEDSIKKLSPLEFTRLRPDTYCGSTADSTQLVTEIVSNSVDEHLIGNCTKIDIDIAVDGTVTVTDDGQGILPNVYKEDGKTVLEMVYGEINASGKFDKSSTATYKVSTGAFGIGSSLVTFLSHYIKATSKRGGQYETVYFEEGVFSHREAGKCGKNEHGVTVEFKPSEEFFTNAMPDVEKLKANIDNITSICPDLVVVLNGTEYSHPDGIGDLIKTSVQDWLFDGVLQFDVSNDDNQRLTLALGYSSGDVGKVVPFCNYGIIESGVPVSTVKGCITKTLNKWGQDEKILKKNETLSGTSLQEGLIVAFNLVSHNIRYDSQTKVRCTSTEDNAFINDVLSTQLERWLDNNPSFGRAILDKALVAKRAAEAAKKARDAVKNKASKQDKVFKMPTKLVDAWSKDRSECELFICEGLSAASGLVAAREGRCQSVYGVRGKCLSVLKATPAKILANQEINNLIQALGLDCDQKTAKLTYDKDKLRYGKIIACADAD